MVTKLIAFLSKEITGKGVHPIAHDICIMTAAQWILWDGEELLRVSRSRGNRKGYEEEVLGLETEFHQGGKR